MVSKFFLDGHRKISAFLSVGLYEYNTLGRGLEGECISCGKPSRCVRTKGDPHFIEEVDNKEVSCELSLFTQSGIKIKDQAIEFSASVQIIMIF
jgi:hypothetical protein